jgi:hypothetical protein
MVGTFLYAAAYGRSLLAKWPELQSRFPEDERLQIIGIQPNNNPSGLLFWAIIMNDHVSPFSSQVEKGIAIVITVVRI